MLRQGNSPGIMQVLCILFLAMIPCLKSSEYVGLSLMTYCEDLLVDGARVAPAVGTGGIGMTGMNEAILQRLRDVVSGPFTLSMHYVTGKLPHFACSLVLSSPPIMVRPASQETKHKMNRAWLALNVYDKVPYSKSALFLHPLPSYNYLPPLNNYLKSHK